jgi:hypothetical protein
MMNDDAVETTILESLPHGDLHPLLSVPGTYVSSKRTLFLTGDSLFFLLLEH